MTSPGMQSAFCIIVICSSCVGLLSAQGMIPDVLLACYRNNSLLLREKGLPMNMATLIELIQKVEMQPGAALDMRTMSYTLLHKLRMDGIERDPTVSESRYVVPIVLKGRQYAKYSVLLGKLLAGHDLFFPEGSLTDVEMCAMHAMLSGAVDPWARGDEGSVCPYSLNDPGSGASQLTYLESRCPLERGVVSTPWGTVSPGHVIGAIAAALQPQQVRVGRLVELPGASQGYQPQRAGRLVELPGASQDYQPQDVELLQDSQPKDDAEQMKYYHKLQELPESEAVSNMWAATLAGDLSEVAVFQGPSGNTLQLGLSGQWNDTALPREQYLQQAGPWDMTAAEIAGGLDGIILASKVPQWAKLLNRLRLSQVLDMFYSDRGVSFDPSYSACARGSKARPLMDPERLLNETTNFARVLYYNSRQSLQLNNVEELSQRAVAAFTQSLDSILTSVSCVGNSSLPPRVTLHVILDSTWRGYDAVRLIGALAERIHVSRHGSSLGVLAGKGSESGWLVNITNSYTELVESLREVTVWPTDLDLPLSLTTLLGYLNGQTQTELLEGVVGSSSHVVLVLGYSATISDTSYSTTQEMLELFRNQQRDVHFLYVTSSQNRARFQGLVKADSLNVDSVIAVDSTHYESVVDPVANKLRQVPWRIISGLCDTRAATVSGEMEDYITPGLKNVYRIHPDYLQRVDQLTLRFRGSGYGTLSVCWSREKEAAAAAASGSCVEVSGQQETLVNVSNPCGGGACLPVYLSVEATETFHKCAEDDCRYPDQVRFTLLQEGLSCFTITGNSTTANTSLAPTSVGVPSLVATLLALVVSLLRRR